MQTKRRENVARKGEKGGNRGIGDRDETWEKGGKKIKVRKI
jgi:hypothetical protein